MNCIHQDTCEYAQPFFVGAKGRWGDYLPAICEPAHCRDYESAPRPITQEIIYRHSDMGKQEFDLLQQTALKTDHLGKKLTEYLQFKKAKDEDYIYS